MQNAVSTLIVHPQPVFREGLRRILMDAGFDLVWCEASPPISILPSVRIDAAPLIIIGGEIGEAAAQADCVRTLYPEGRIVLLAERMLPHQVATVMRGRASTVISEQSSCDLLVSSLRLALDDVAVLPAEFLAALGEALRQGVEPTLRPPEPLSFRQPGLTGRTAHGVKARNRRAGDA